MRIAANAYDEYGGRFFHNDTTTMSLQGEYEHEEGDLDAVPIEITHDFSKDHRPDLSNSSFLWSCRMICPFSYRS